MAHIRVLTLEGFRSIRDQIQINFPQNKPVVLIGENNCGKSNIIRGLDVLFGEFHPKYKDMESFDHNERDSRTSICIEADVNGFKGKLGKPEPKGVVGFKYKTVFGKEAEYHAILTDGSSNQYITNDIRSELTSIIVNTEQNLSYQLSYSSKHTLLSKVMKAFHTNLISDKERVNKLKKLYNEIQKTFDEVPEFRTFKDDMSTIAGQILTSMSYKLEIDFSAYDPSNFFKSLRVNPCEDGDARSFEELGTGQQQLLALTFAHAYSKSFIEGDIILVLDEPESHLHPLAQKWLAKQIYKMAADGLQVIITTHSPNFIDLLNIDGLYLLRKEKGVTFVSNHNAQSLYEYSIKTGANNLKTKVETVVPFYANHSTTHILNGFFAKKVILVEGLTEELSLPIYLERVGLDITKEGFAVIGVQGKGNLAKWWRLFTLYEIPTFVCFDNDNKHDKEAIQRKDSLKAIGISDEELEDIIGENDWSISEKYCVFGVDFETTMKLVFNDYGQIEEEQKNSLGTASKHIIARETAKLLTMEDNEGWKNFSILKNKILALGKTVNVVLAQGVSQAKTAYDGSDEMLEILKTKFDKSSKV